MKKLRKNLNFDGTSGLRLEIMSYSDSAYDVTNIFCCFEKFLAYTPFLLSFVVFGHRVAESNWGGWGFFAPPRPCGDP